MRQTEAWRLLVSLNLARLREVRVILDKLLVSPIDLIPLSRRATEHRLKRVELSVLSVDSGTYFFPQASPE